MGVLQACCNQLAIRVSSEEGSKAHPTAEGDKTQKTLLGIGRSKVQVASGLSKLSVLNHRAWSSQAMQEEKCGLEQEWLVLLASLVVPPPVARLLKHPNPLLERVLQLLGAHGPASINVLQTSEKPKKCFDMKAAYKETGLNGGSTGFEAGFPLPL